MSEPDRSARDQLSSDYERIMSDGYSSRWQLTNPGNRAMLDEREALLAELTGSLPQRALRVLDLGCGNLTILPGSLVIDVRIGVDLLFGRLSELRTREETPTPTVNADGAMLPFADATFDVVVMSTMMTSVLDDGVRRAVASEVERVLRAGGSLLWYDLRMPNPRNPATRAIGKAELRRLFPNLHGEIRSLTVVPVVARRLGSLTPQLYAMLRRVPFMRAHLAACLVKST